MNILDLKTLTKKTNKIEFNSIPKTLFTYLDRYKSDLKYLSLDSIEYFEESKSVLGFIIPVTLPLESQKLLELKAILKRDVYLFLKGNKAFIYFKSFKEDIWLI